MSEINNVPADWAIYRCVECPDWIGSLYRINNAACQDRVHTDPKTIKAATAPVSLIECYTTSYGKPLSIGISVFLPDRAFSDLWRLVEIAAASSMWAYTIQFDFIGFHDIEPNSNPNFMSHGEWIRGRPYLPREFRFTLSKRAQVDVGHLGFRAGVAMVLLGQFRC
jgi:hypothetical protein